MRRPRKFLALLSFFGSVVLLGCDNNRGLSVRFGNYLGAIKKLGAPPEFDFDASYE